MALYGKQGVDMTDKNDPDQKIEEEDSKGSKGKVYEGRKRIK